MFLRRTQPKGSDVPYYHLAESYRREGDGAPRQRLIASLGPLTDQEAENFRAALAANRDGGAIVVAPAKRAAGGTRAPKPQANLRFLDVAVGLELWRELGLDRLLTELLPSTNSATSDADVVAALTLQRLVDPGSKLSATRWFPRTALPLLLGVAEQQFNNTRLHRALERLEQVRQHLMARLPALHSAHRGAGFAALFLDVTDTWFVGHGPDLARRAKTKEGRVERKIGVVLLCDHEGLPLRWEVVEGTRADADAMFEVLRATSGLPWTADAPVVVDRAMGCSAHLRELQALDLRFLTALRSTEIPAYSADVPHDRFADLAPSSEDDEATMSAARSRAEEAGLTPAAPNLLVRDLGVVTPHEEHSAPEGPTEPPSVTAIRTARALAQGLASGRFESLAAAAKELRVTRPQCKKFRPLADLQQDLQDRVLTGEGPFSIDDLLQVAKLSGEELQRVAFAELRPSTRSRVPAKPTREDEPATPLRVRAVLCFNPQLFVQKRHFAQARVARVHQFVADLNRRLAEPGCRRGQTKVAAEIDAYLRKDDLVNAFSVEIVSVDLDGRKHLRADVTLDERVWATRRRYDGFMLLVASPELPHGAHDLARLYRQKDVVEKDFQTIKNVLDVRPVRHRDTDKVCAHVTLCVLALLLERTLRKKLDGDPSPQAALEELETCRLNRFQGTAEAGPVYTINQLNAAQAKILATLRLTQLGDDEHIAERITHRTCRT